MMRRHNRFFTDVPVKRQVSSSVFYENETLQDISVDGLCFHSSEYVEPESVVSIEISIFDPVFKVKGQVIWCRQNGNGFNTGIQFMRIEAGSSIKTVEYLQYLDQYKRNLYFTEGRKITGEEAFSELVHKNTSPNMLN